MNSYRLKMLIEVRFDAPHRDDAFFAFTRWWKEHAGAYEVRALEVSQLSETPASGKSSPPAVENEQEDLL